MLDDIQTQIRQLLEPGVSEENIPVNCFSTENFLNQPRFLSAYNQDYINVFDQLTKKIEVVRRLYQFYNPYDIKPMGVKYVSFKTCDLFLCHSMCLYLIYTDYKFLNTILKMADGILKSPCYLPTPKVNHVLDKFLKNVL